MLSQPLVISLSLSGLLAGVSAHFNNPHHARYAHPNPTAANLFVERGDPYPTTGPEYAIPPLESIVPTPADYSQDTLPVKATYTSGTQPSLSGAPPLPAPTVDQSSYPTPDELAPTNTTEVLAWINAIDWTTIPDIPVNKARDCSDPQVQAAIAAAGPDQNCWWTCGGCTRDVDITTCANPMEYGHGYDDGPGLYTNKLLAYLESRDLKATFYLVGSRVYYRPEIVRYEYMTGHELSVHTWSHGGENQLGLTELTNEQIVAELGYTRKIIHEVTGVTPLTMRPPFGDIDDRVRAISLAMGMIPVIWTSKPNPVAGGPQIQWDSQDWKVHAPADQGGVPSVSNQQNFEAILDSSSNFTDHGVIALQHDIYVEAVNLAIGYTLPYLLDTHQPPFSLKPIMQCQGFQDVDMYLETNTNHDSPAINGSGDVATRTSNLGYAAHNSDQVSVPASRTYATSMGSGTGTHTASTSNSNTTGGAVNVKAAGGLASLLFGSIVGGVMLL